MPLGGDMWHCESAHISRPQGVTDGGAPGQGQLSSEWVIRWDAVTALW
jgi:hypothetical protein